MRPATSSKRESRQLTGFIQYGPDMLPIFGLMFFQKPFKSRLVEPNRLRIRRMFHSCFLRRQTVPSTFSYTVIAG